jgi:hypothetical protein
MNGNGIWINCMNTSRCSREGDRGQSSGRRWWANTGKGEGGPPERKTEEGRRRGSRWRVGIRDANGEGPPPVVAGSNHAWAAAADRPSIQPRGLRLHPLRCIGVGDGGEQHRSWRRRGAVPEWRTEGSAVGVGDRGERRRSRGRRVAEGQRDGGMRRGGTTGASRRR